MSFIEVNRNEIKRVASIVDTYVEIHKAEMSKADSTVAGMSMCWSGDDYIAFSAQWDEATEKDSISAKMIRDFEAYANTLRFAENRYYMAQEKATNRANLLPCY